MKKASVISLLVFILLYVSPVTIWLYAQKVEYANTPYEPQIIYKGERNKSLIFDVFISEVLDNTFIKIRNENGDVLFENRINVKQFQQRFRILPMGLKEVQFELVTKSKRYKEVFLLERQYEEKLVVYQHK